MSPEITCEFCFSDQAIKKFIRKNRTLGRCEFCSTGSAHTIYVGEVCELIKTCLREEYDHPENCLPWDGREGGWQIGKIFDSAEILDEIGLDLPNDSTGELHKTIINSLGDQAWCDKEPFRLSKSERLTFNWEEFCNKIKYHTRYFFMRQSHTPPYLDDGESRSIPEFLRILVRICENLKIPKAFKKNSKVFRARFQNPGETLCDTVDLGPPSEGGTLKPNRMSPAGIVHFYASSNRKTAFAEIEDSPGIYKIGEFKIQRRLTLLDFTKPLRIPSFFDPTQTKRRHQIIFIKKFIKELSKPVTGERINIDYIPTQVICEYFRTQVKIQSKPINGICYPSAKRAKGKSYVIFANQNDLSLSEGEFKKLKDLNQLSKYFQKKVGWIKLTGVSRITKT